ncbi:acyl carrier protein [Corynebacterium sp. 3HC-13]|nr:acyl carrier protein [Corynebacterium poyangense]MBZ8178452.1 acyl carrier protein [Corynebacterium poyangense]
MTSIDSPDSGIERRTADLKTLAGILQDTTGVDASEITPDTNLVEDLHISSLSLIETTVRAEEALGVQLEDEHVLSFNTVGDFLDYVDGLRVLSAREKTGAQ